MIDLAAKTEQHAAAMTYLDTGTLALAEVLAALDDEPPVDGPDAPNVPRRHRRRRAVSWGFWGVRTGAMAAAVGLGLFALAPHASEPAHAAPPVAASPFDDGTFRASAAAAGLSCTPQTVHHAVCADASGDVVPMDAYIGDTDTRYVDTVRTPVGVARNVLVVFSSDDAEDAFLASDAPALQNVRQGKRWVAWSNTPAAVDAATHTLPPRSAVPKPSAAPQPSAPTSKRTPVALKSPAPGHAKKSPEKH
jgi:hypothetical protein